MLRALFFCLAVLLPLAAPAAADGGVTAADMEEIRGVIHRQIDAFRRDDAQSAFAVAFLELVVMGGDVVQPVQVTDRSGAVWVAYYAMQRQHDGSWRTHGCHLIQPNRTISA